VLVVAADVAELVDEDVNPLGQRIARVDVDDAVGVARVAA